MLTVLDLDHAAGLYLPSWSSRVPEKLTISLFGVIFDWP